MSKRMKVLVSVLVAVLLLVAGGTASVMAQEEEPSTPPVRENSLLASVAEILGIPEEDLVDAFKQAQQEMMEERWKETFNRALDKAVEEGLLTQEEVDEIREWWEQKPEVLDRGLLRHAFGFMAPGSRQMLAGRGARPEIRQKPWHGPNPRAWQSMGPEAFNRVLEKASEKGHVTLEDTDKIDEWREIRPETSNRLSTRARIFKAIRGRQMIAAPGGGGGPGLPEPLD